MKPITWLMLLLGVIGWFGCGETENQIAPTPGPFVFEGSNLKEETTLNGAKIYTLPPNSDLIITYSFGLANAEVTTDLFTLEELPGSQLIKIENQPHVFTSVVIHLNLVPETRPQIAIKEDDGQIRILESQPLAIKENDGQIRILESQPPVQQLPPIIRFEPPQPIPISPLEFTVTSKRLHLDSVRFKVKDRLLPGHQYELTAGSIKSTLGDIALPLKFNFFVDGGQKLILGHVLK